MEAGVKVDGSIEGRKRMAIFRRFGGLMIAALAIAFATLPVAGGSSGRQDGKQDKDKKGSGKSAGVILSNDATAEDVGLPLYPGSQRLKETPDESSAVQL